MFQLHSISITHHQHHITTIIINICSGLEKIMIRKNQKNPFFYLNQIF